MEAEQIEREMRRLVRQPYTPESELFVAGARLAFDWVRNGGLSPSEYLDSRFGRSSLEH